MRRKRTLTRFALQIVGTFDLFAFAALVLSDDSMAGVHQALGMGELPAAPIVGYLARTASLQYGLHGVLLWAISFDVARYSPLVPLLGTLKLVQALAIAIVDATGGMPLWWTIVEPACLALAGAALLLAWRTDRPATAERSG